MSKVNTPELREKPRTHQGARASQITPTQELRRSVMSCLLFEGEFYEEGASIADRIRELAAKVPVATVSAIAREAREKMHLRHAPLWLCLAMLGHKDKIVSETITAIIQRADELAELLALYWQNGKKPLPAQLKKGLAGAFGKFDEYQLAKYNRPAKVSLRDVLFLTHPTPKDETQATLWNKLAANELAIPDTWEVALSGGANKKEAFERLLIEKRLGCLDLLRNLRNMVAVGVNRELLQRSLLARPERDRVLPFRFISAALACPELEQEIEQALLLSLEREAKLPGKTILIVDVSGSMYSANLSIKSDIARAQVAASLAILIRELAEHPCIYATAGNDTNQTHATEFVPSRRGFALSDYILGRCTPLGGGGIFLTQVCEFIKKREGSADRIIVITDEQDCDNDVRSPLRADAFGQSNYLINVASNKNGIGYGKWTHIDGWSEAVVDYIRHRELEDNNA